MKQTTTTHKRAGSPVHRTVKKKSVSSRIHHHVKMAVVPHKGNGYHPHLLRWQGLSAVLLAIIFIQSIYFAVQSGQVLGQEADLTSQQLLAATNDERERNGESALRLSADLSLAATKKAKDMFVNQYWAHTSPSGLTPWHWIDQSGYAYEAAGENLAVDFKTTSGVVRAWMNSPEHRKNLLGSVYRDVGFAVLKGTLLGRTTMLVVAMYGEPKVSDTAIIPTVLAATDSTSIITKFGEKLQTGSPTLLASVALLLSVAIVALVAHQYRHNLPKEWRTGWRRHHALYKAVGMVSIIIIITMLYQGGQI